MKAALRGLAGALLLALPGAAAAIALTTLADGALTITQGDKVFSDFHVNGFQSIAVNDEIFGSPLTSASASPGSAGEIDVSGVTIDGEHGLHFSVPQSSFLASADCNLATRDCANAQMDFSVTYTVTVLGPDLVDGFTLIPFDPGTITAPSSGRVSTGTSSLGFSGIFSPFTTSVTRDLVPASTFTLNTGLSLLATANCPGGIFPPPCAAGRVELGSFAVVFSQLAPQAAAPEPASLALMALGLAGLGFGRRRRRPR